jgi:hypothetical protein
LFEIECDRNMVVAANKATATNAEIIKRFMADLREEGKPLPWSQRMIRTGCGFAL